MSPHLIDQIPSKSRKHSVSSCNLTENTFSCPRLSLEPLGVGAQISQLSLSHAEVTSKLQNVVGLARRSSPQLCQCFGNSVGSDTGIQFPPLLWLRHLNNGFYGGKRDS